MNVLVFAFVWGYGAQIDLAGREKFDLFLQDMIAGEDCVEKYKINDVDPATEIKSIRV